MLGGKPVFPIRFAHFRNVLIVFYGFSWYAYFHRDTFYLHSVVSSITAIVVVVVLTKWKTKYFIVHRPRRHMKYGYGACNSINSNLIGRMERETRCFWFYHPVHYRNTLNIRYSNDLITPNGLSYSHLHSMPFHSVHKNCIQLQLVCCDFNQNSFKACQWSIKLQFFFLLHFIDWVNEWDLLKSLRI